MLIFRNIFPQNLNFRALISSSICNVYKTISQRTTNAVFQEAKEKQWVYEAVYVFLLVKMLYCHCYLKQFEHIWRIILCLIVMKMFYPPVINLLQTIYILKFYSDIL